MLVRGMGLRQWTQLLRDSCRGGDSGPQHVFLCIADHYEPDWGRASETLRATRVKRWVDEYPRSVTGITDSLGRVPQHTFFFPLEEYRARLLDQLAGLCHAGFGEVEVHLHHDRDTSERLRSNLEWFKDTLHLQHGLLHRDQNGQIRYGFIHGNWALDNSRHDGCWCGVNDELTVLRETGCYADFTMPSAPDSTQTRTINGIYYAFDDPCQPKSHDVGQSACVGGQVPADGLLMIQGPLALDWRDRKFGFSPRLENSDLHAGRPPAANRLDLWQKAGVSVQGRPEWKFVKLHTHGAKEANADVLLGKPMRQLHHALAERARMDQQFRYYYVTAREMSLLVHAAEAGVTDPQVVLRQTHSAENYLQTETEIQPASETGVAAPLNCCRLPC